MSSQTITITDPVVNETTAPLNVEAPIVFGWQYQSQQQALKQSAYQLQVKDATDTLVYDSGVVQSAKQAQIRYNGAPLQPASRYWWRVQGQFNDLASDWSAWQPFGTGLRDADWAPAAWLSRTLEPDEEERDQWSLFRQVVTIEDKPLQSATSFVSAVHAFDLFIDEGLVDRGQNFAYAGEGYYQAADVTKALQGKTRVGIGALTHYDGAGQGRAASRSGFLFKLVLRFGDGSVQTIVSDGTWQTTKAGFLKSTLRNGEGDNLEAQDAQRQKALQGWSRADYDASAWQKPEVLGVHPTEPFMHVQGLLTRQVDELVKPISVTTLDDGSILADFGKIMPLRPQVHFHQGQAGRVVTIQAGLRLLANGHIDTSKLATQGTDMRFLDTQAAGVQNYRAQIHLGCRYLEIQNADEPLGKTDISALCHRRAWPAARATFYSSDAALNAVFDLMAHSLQNGVQETFVDTPTREKGQFLVDAANVSYGTMALFGERATTVQAIKEFVASQHRYWFNSDDAGRYNAVYPNGDGKRDIPDYTELFPDWVWQYFTQSHDRDLLQEVYPSLRATADYILRHVATEAPFTGLVTELAGGHGGGPYLYGIIDWPVQGRFGYDMATKARTTVNALAVRTLTVVADAAVAIGDVADAALLRKRATALSAAINAILINAQGLYVDGLDESGQQSQHVSQHANAYAVAFGIAPKAKQPALVDWLAAQGMKQGPMTVHWLLKALGDNQRFDALLKLFTNADDWGWAKSLKAGNTFTPEAWQLSGDANSESHAWGAQAIVDMLTYFAGVQTDPMQAGQFTIDLAAISVLDTLQASVPTDFGAIKVDWQHTQGKPVATISLPVNTQATVTFDGETKELQSGTWRLTGNAE